MSGFKGTPAPWIVEENPCVKPGLQVASFSEYGNRTLQVVVYSNHHEEDSSLIAAAPELLEALEAMLEIHGVTQSYAETHSEIPQSWVEVSDIARAAIAKALGEE